MTLFGRNASKKPRKLPSKNSPQDVVLRVGEADLAPPRTPERSKKV